ncbi:hypothetical protein C2G38_2256556 [Gigaspora rosea]|uniref:Uncharacterized protein n=1 Tax=Gigaspora rosea TaxID=44941 RepID=A0A397TRQ7_9GLOM|nr:hypothetical protein C2G38_2256556 [Gigaspora rosea]
MEEDISMIQNYLGIVGYTDEEMIKEEAEKDGVKHFTREASVNSEGIHSTQLHEIFVKNPSSAGQCPYLEQVS